MSQFDPASTGIGSRQGYPTNAVSLVLETEVIFAHWDDQKSSIGSARWLVWQHPLRCPIYLAVGDFLISGDQDNEERGGPFNVGGVFHMISGPSQQLRGI